MKAIFLTYATDDFTDNARLLTRSARAVGFDECLLLGPKDIQGTDFYNQNREILTQPRGGGYWLWKPYIILKLLDQLSFGDSLFYCDAGRSDYYTFSNFPHRLIESAHTNSKGFLLGPVIPHLGNLSQWTKRDCFILMGADNNSMRARAPIQTSPSVWTPTNSAKQFLEKWLQYCKDPRCLTDIPNECGYPNDPAFKDHRHDQAILSILAYQTGAPHLDFSKTVVHKLIELRPRSSLGANFYKRPQNINDLLGRDNPYLLIREFLRLRRATDTTRK